MSGQEWAALAITGTALTWLVWRWRRRGLGEEGEHDAQGCGSCPKGAAPESERLHPLGAKNGAGPAVEPPRSSRPATEAGRPERPPPAHP